MTRQERQQMLGHTDGADTGSTTPMGDAERLVQIEVTDVGAEGARAAQADLGIEVGPIQIHLAAMVVNQAADLTDAGLEHPMG